MVIHNSFLDIHKSIYGYPIFNWFMDIKNDLYIYIPKWFMDIQNLFMDILKWILDIHK